MFNVQETILKFKKHRKYKTADLKYGHIGRLFIFGQCFSIEMKCIFIIFSNLESLPTTPKINI